MGKSSSPPSPSGPSSQELDLYNSQKQLLDQARGLIGNEATVSEQDRNLLRNLSGLYDASGNLDPNAVANLRGRLASQQTQSENIGNLFAQRQQQALSGQSPLSSEQIQAERDAFGTLKSSAAQRGIRISGNDIFTATSDSTAGNQLLQGLRRNAEQQRERRINDVIYGPTPGQPGNIGLGILGQSQAAGPAGAAQGYLGLGQAYGNLAQPYQQQRMLNYQYQIQRAANRGARAQGIGGIIGGGLGAALGGFGAGAATGGLGAGAGAGLGFGIGSGVGGAFGSLF